MRRPVALLQDAATWTVTDAGGQPSTALSVTASAAERLGQPVGALVATEPVAGARAEAAISAADLRAFDDLELWVQADRPADGSSTSPWYLELRLGSAARPIGSAGNTWRRFLPLRGDGRWEAVVVGTADLPDAVRQAVTAVRLTCVDASAPFRCAIDGPWAVRAAVVADVDEALATLLDGGIELDGSPVPLVFEPVPAPDPTGPALRARQTTTRLRRDLPDSGERRTDFSDEGFLLRPAAVPVELGYELRPEADNRADQVAILEFALTALASTHELDVSGRPASLQLTEPGPAVGDPPALTISVLTSLRPAAVPVVGKPISNLIDVEVDSLAPA